MMTNPDFMSGMVKQQLIGGLVPQVCLRVVCVCGRARVGARVCVGAN